ncbi:MAG: DUF1376 domain-containing protein [Phycisphaerales bacterium]|jgi:uncharacterized protein YdaU (DUF1376 family)
MNDSYYQRYPGDYLRDTIHLSLVEHGAYTILLDAYYSNGVPFPSDLTKFVKARARNKSEKDALLSVADEFFPVSDDGLRHNARADRELSKRKAYTHAQALRAGMRWHSAGNAKAMPETCAGNAEAMPPSPSPSPSPEPPPTPTPAGKKTTSVRKAHAYSHEYEELWKIHSYGVKAKGWEEYQRMDSPPEHGEMVKILTSQVQAEAESRTNGARLMALPHLERWIKNRQWENGVVRLERAAAEPKIKIHRELTEEEREKIREIC